MVTLRALPTLLVVGALVATFVSIQRHNRTPRLRLWVFGWILIFIHMGLSVFVPTSGLASHIFGGLSLGTLAVAGLVFLVSVTTLVYSDEVRPRVLLFASVPVVVYTAMLAWGSERRFTFLLLAAWITFGGAGWFFAWYRKLSGYVLLHTTICAGLGVTSIGQIWLRNYESGFYTILLGMYGLSALLFIRRYPRLSPGVVLAAGGFLAWASVWAVASFATALVIRAGIDNLIWDVPKIFVGFGMVVTLLEDQYLTARSAGRRERILNVQMARFADLTSKLLGGVEVRSLCGEIARVINEVANFRRVVIALVGDNNRMLLAGHAGIEDEIRTKLDQNAANMTPGDIRGLCEKGRRIGQDSYIYPREIAESIGSALSTRAYEPNPNWNTGDEMIVPIRTAQGNIVGCISLDDPKSVNRVTPEEISKIEMLANDIGVAIEKSTLQQKIMVQEKLASVGQLVSGVAHELNNPLTAVMGYTELLLDADKEGKFQRELSVMRREAQRMKVIIDNLLRFARQSRMETTTARIDQVVQEAITLREYDINRAGVKIEKRIEDGLPAVACDEAQLKTVVVHLINNSIDAMKETAEKSLQIDARRVGDRVLISFLDNGPGFPDVTRVFDPFFTTKGVGRGTGLGLSICYGIVKQHGGEIYAQNMPPTGACVSMELRIAAESKKEQGLGASV